MGRPNDVCFAFGEEVEEEREGPRGALLRRENGGWVASWSS